MTTPNGRLPPPMPLRNLLRETEGVIIGNKRHRVPGARVLTWLEHNRRFRVGQGHNKRRVADIDLVVWHWTGGENPPLVMANTLENKGYGIEFAIDGDDVDGFATIYQLAEPLTVDTADAGVLNPRSVGVEVVSYGVKSWDRAWQVPKRGADRRLSTQRIHGKSVQVAAFRPSQIRSARALARVLSDVLEIPMQIPLLPNGKASGELFTPQQMRTFKGHCGHHNISAKKLDCGTQLLEDLIDPAWERAT
jgi:hypothetical protein